MDQEEPGKHADASKAHSDEPVVPQDGFKPAACQSPCSMYDPVRSHVQHAKMRVAISPVVLDRAHGLRRATCKFCLDVFEAARQHELGAMLRAGHRIADRLASDVNEPGDRDTASALLLVDLKLDRPEQRLVEGL